MKTTPNYTVEDLENALSFPGEAYRNLINGREHAFHSFTQFLEEIRSNTEKLEDAVFIAEDAYRQICIEIEGLDNSDFEI